MKKISVFENVNRFLRSLLFSVLMIVGTCFYSFLCLIFWVLPLRFRFRLIQTFTSFLLWSLKIICRINYKIEGLENISQNRNGVIMSKHQSAWETFLLQNLFPNSAIIVKRELFWVPFFGWGLASISPIAINRSDKSSAMEQVITKGKTCLQQGRYVLVFPEGTRVAPGHVGHYRLGGARLATATGFPVIPVAHNSGRFWPRRKFIKRPGTVHVVIGPMIETQGRKSEEVLEEVKKWIETTMLRIDEKN